MSDRDPIVERFWEVIGQSLVLDALGSEQEREEGPFQTSGENWVPLPKLPE